MAKSYRKPIVKVESVWSVKVNSGTYLLVEKGDKIKKDQPIAKRKKKIFEKINACAELSNDPKKIEDGLLFKKGDQIQKGDCLILTKTFPLKIKKLFSPVSGQFEDYNNLTGEIKITTSREEEEIISPVDGEVIDAGKDSLKVKFKAYRIIGESTGKGKKWGELIFISKDDSFPENIENKLLFMDRLASLDVKKGMALGVGGFLCFEIPADLEDLEKPFLLFKTDKEAVREKLIELSGSSALLDSNSGQLLICMS